MKLIIVRHGETKENATDILTGHTPGKLSEKGIEQAKKLALRLKDKKIDYIYSSDLQRTRDTLSEVLKFHNSPVVYDPLLREKTNGIFDGGSKKKYIKTRELNSSNSRWHAPGGENFYDVKRRVRTFIESLKREHNENDCILIMTHGGWKNTLISYLMKIPRKQTFLIPFDNTSLSIIQLQKDKEPRIKLINCTKHLEDVHG